MERELELRSLAYKLLGRAVGRGSDVFCHQLAKTDSEIEQLPRECSLDQLRDAYEMEIETVREHLPHLAHKRCNTFS